MALTSYLGQVESLLDDFGNVEYTQANLTTYINDARVQIAGASESIRSEVTLTLAASTQVYPFSAATALPSGVQGIIAARMLRIQTIPSDPGPPLVPASWRRLEQRSWEWFATYRLSQSVTTLGQPTMVTQLNPGVSGTLWFDPVPDIAYVTAIDAVGYPAALVDDTTVEALSYPWTEAVQYYAAYLALLNSQRRADADAMFSRYTEFETRATQMTGSSRLPKQFPGGEGARVAGQNMPITARRQ